MPTRAPAQLRCEYHVNPIGIEEARPRLSWQLEDDRRGARQSAYRVLVASSLELLAADKGDLWDSGIMKSDRSIQVEYEGTALKSRQRAHWKVRAWDADDQPGAWSEPVHWEMGLLCRDDWKAAWIGSHLAGSGTTSAAVPFLRKSFRIDQPVASARLYVTALGLYECEINGQRVSDDVFRPGWTDYAKRVQYQTFDVTGSLRQGENAIGAMLGDGWYCGSVAWQGRQVYGDRPRLLAQLHVRFEGSPELIVTTDETWRYAFGPIVESDMLNGEMHDARRELGRWTEGDYDASGWLPALVFDDPGIARVAQLGPSVRRIEELRPIADPVPARHGGRLRWVFDLGQNIAGWARLRLKAKAGTTATLRFAEMLQKNGELYVENLRGARATDHYTFASDAEATWEPRFTFHGFRYVELALPHDAEVTRDTITGVVIHSDTPETGSFECSHPLINQLQSNIRWGQRGNFIDVPTDCPQRNERLGWTGDAQVFVRTACFNMDVASFFTKWQQDLADAQAASGSFPSVAPNPGLDEDGGPAWADAGIICPWTIFQCFDDQRLLERHFESMREFIDFLVSTARDHIRCHSRGKVRCYGDWLAIDAPNPGAAPTPKELIGTAYFVHAARLLGRIAAKIGKTDEAEKLTNLAETVRAAFNREFVTPSGRIVGDSQTGYLLALGFELLDKEHEAAALDYLTHDIERRGWHLSTGFVGTPLLCPVLTRMGRADIAYKLLMQETYPSWIYPIHQGATTMWERWNSYTHEHGFGDAGMNSFNHYAYGAIGEWMYATVGGLNLIEPAYKRSRVAPIPGEGMTHASTSLKTMFGRLACEWRIEGNKLTMNAVIPANTSAEIIVPGADARVEGDETGLKKTGDNRFDAGAGEYRFVSSMP